MLPVTDDASGVQRDVKELQPDYVSGLESPRCSTLSGLIGHVIQPGLVEFRSNVFPVSTVKMARAVEMESVCQRRLCILHDGTQFIQGPAI